MKDEGNMVKDILSSVYNDSYNGYQQIGTNKFTPEGVCQSTKIALRAPYYGSEKWTLNNSEAFKDLVAWSDGYQLDMKIILGQEME